MDTDSGEFINQFSKDFTVRSAKKLSIKSSADPRINEESAFRSSHFYCDSKRELVANRGSIWDIKKEEEVLDMNDFFNEPFYISYFRPLTKDNEQFFVAYYGIDKHGEKVSATGVFKNLDKEFKKIEDTNPSVYASTGDGFIFRLSRKGEFYNIYKYVFR